MATKRSASPTSPSSPSASPSHKSARIVSDARELVCSLPPTCSRNGGTRLQGTRELEAHYAKFHAHVCSAPGCECIFPEARLLELHLTECHDSLAEVRKERGEKIFACHLATCPKYFRTPKNRRNHLISAHGYPRQYFFAITNYGMGEMLRRWGEGASMVRGDWRPREPAEDGSSDEDDAMEEDDHESATSIQKQRMNGRQAPPHMATASTSTPRPLPTAQPTRPHSTSHAPNNATQPTGPTAQPQTINATTTSDSNALDALADTMSSLSLVPTSIRFGRGAKSSGHIGRHSHTVTFASPVAETRPLPPRPPTASTTSISTVPAPTPAKETPVPTLGSGLSSLKLSPVLATATQNGAKATNSNGSKKNGTAGATATNGRFVAARATGQSDMPVDTASPTSPTSPASHTSNHTAEGTASKTSVRGHGSRGGFTPRGGFGPRGRGFGPRGRGKMFRGGRGRGG